MTATLFDFDGATYQPAHDCARLNRQLQKVYEIMRDGVEHTPEELERRTGENWASISARLRDLRKPKFGRHRVLRRRIERGVFGYRLEVR